VHHCFLVSREVSVCVEVPKTDVELIVVTCLISKHRHQFHVSLWVCDADMLSPHDFCQQSLACTWSVCVP